MMQSSRRNALAFAALATVSVAASVAWRPRTRLVAGREAIQLETVFPRRFGNWSVDSRQPIQLVSPDTQAALDKIYSQVLSRTYIDTNGERIMLSVAYGGDQSDATRTHRPEVCYPAQGFQVNSSSQGVIALADGTRLPVRRLVTKQGSRVEPLTYWVVVGDRIALSGTEQKLAQLSYGMRGVIPDGMLVRVSSIDSNPGRALALQEQFVRELATSVDLTWRPNVMGRS